jgi:hypothetical protein
MAAGKYYQTTSATSSSDSNNSGSRHRYIFFYIIFFTRLTITLIYLQISLTCLNTNHDDATPQQGNFFFVFCLTRAIIIAITATMAATPLEGAGIFIYGMPTTTVA